MICGVNNCKKKFTKAITEQLKVDTNSCNNNTIKDIAMQKKVCKRKKII